MSSPGLDDWAAKWGISASAMKDLVSGVTNEPSGFTGKSESHASTILQIEATQNGARLFRNNSGAGKMENGNYIRFGLGNTSPAICAVSASSDLIGLEPILITPSHVGTVIGRFICVEVKKPGWRMGKSKRELAQANWIRMINDKGGRGYFSTGKYERP